MKAFAPEQIKKAANVLRGLAIDEVQKANSGHPGMPMGMADVVATLALDHLRVCGSMPDWPDRDRLVFSGGHGSALLYALLHELGFGLSLDDLKGFRQLGSKTPGHPERGRTAGVEVSTGPLGQGFANAVGMALSQAMAAARFNAPGAELLAHWVWVLCGDGDLEEGISHEAASFAGALKIPRLVALYDSNGISIEGHVEDAFRDDTPARFKAYGWRVLACDGHDPAAIDKALRRAKKLSLEGPVLVVCRTTIGFGSPNRAGTAKVHGEPLGPDEAKLAKKALGLPEDESFHDPADVRALFEARAAAMKRLARKSERVRKAALAADPAKAALWDACVGKTVPADLAAKLPAFDPAKPVATRAASGKVLQTLAAELPWLVGGSADLAPSNKTWLDAYPAVAPGDFSGRNIHFGIRELGMAAIQNGMLADGFFGVYTATFAVFADYVKPALRVAALSELPALYAFTHDSFAVGEDGATHEPVEQLASLRATPGAVVLRPADATETAAAWAVAAASRTAPVALFLSRQNLPVLDRASGDLAPASGVARGAYALWQGGSGLPEAIVMASGSEVALALEAARARPERNVRVVSFPSWELFAAQPQAWRDEVLPPACTKRLAVEAGASMGWEKWTGAAGRVLALDRFGDSAPAGVLAKEYGFTAQNVGAALDALLG
ncbi:MAG: transketolase [Kiritimatiellae bacterium]|nr:transketolase [Kiritimatiellia bacterium]